MAYEICHSLIIGTSFIPPFLVHTILNPVLFWWFSEVLLIRRTDFFIDHFRGWGSLYNRAFCNRSYHCFDKLSFIRYTKPRFCLVGDYWQILFCWHLFSWNSSFIWIRSDDLFLKQFLKILCFSLNNRTSTNSASLRSALNGCGIWFVSENWTTNYRRFFLLRP